MAEVYVDALMFWPMLAMAGLTAVSWAAMGRRRFAAVHSREISLDAFKGEREVELPARAAVATRHFANHFEIPVLFHVVCLAHIVLAAGSVFSAALAWSFVALRALHQREHLGRNHVPVRFRLYVASTALMWVLWVELAVRLAIR